MILMKVIFFFFTTSYSSPTVENSKSKFYKLLRF